MAHRDFGFWHGSHFWALTVGVACVALLLAPLSSGATNGGEDTELFVQRSTLAGVGLQYGAFADIQDSAIGRIQTGLSGATSSILINTTVVASEALASTGGIEVSRFGNIETVNVTIAGRAFLNEPEQSGSCLLRNSIVADAGGGDSTCALDNSLEGAFDDLLVGQLADNGAPGSLDYPLLAGSPANRRQRR